MSRAITIISQLDGTEVNTDTFTASGSILLKSLIEEYEDENKFIIPEIKGDFLILVIKYLENIRTSPLREIPKPLKNYNLKELISEWEYNFISTYDDKIYDLFELINAANYLDVRPLLELACAKAATLIKDYDKDRFIEVFQIEHDMTEDELKQKENDFETKEQKDLEIKRLAEIDKGKFPN